MKRRKRHTTRPLDDWPEATHPADYLGAEQYDEAVVLRWQAPGGRLALVWPLAEGITTVEHYARLLPDADAVALVRLDFGLRGPAVDAISRSTGPYASDYPTLAALLGMPVPYWPATLRIPDVIRTWHPGDPCVSSPARCELESAPLLQLAAAFPDNSPPHRVLVNLVQVAQADATASARQDLEQAAGASTDPLGSDVLTVAALPTSVPAADRDDLDPTTRHAGWLEILRRDGPLALASIRQVMRWNGGRDLPFGHVVTIEEPDVGPAAEWAARLQPCPRTAAAALVDPKGLDEILTDPATDAPVARDIRGRLHAASPRRLPTTSPLAEVILDRQIWIRVADGTLYPAPQHHYFGIGWGYNGSGPATLALTIHRLLEDITAPGGDSTTGAPRGLLNLIRQPWPLGTVLDRDQLLTARGDHGGH